MIPLMLAARKLDGEDPDVVFMLRCAYGAVQGLILLAVLYVYMVATKISKSKLKDEEIFVSPPAQPFAGPDAKKQYTKTTVGAEALKVASKLGFSTLSGLCMTVGLHWYKGMIIGLAMQTIMGPLNLLENSFAKNILLGGGKDKDEKGEKRRFFDEKFRSEMTDKDEVVDAEGKMIVLKKEKKDKNSKSKSFEDLLLDTWDDGATADIEPLVKAFKKDNINFKTKESGWTPLMVMAAIGAKGAVDAIKKMKSIGASATVTDNEGWNALHWAAFHGSLEGAIAVMDAYDGIKLSLHLTKDKEGMTPLEHASKEGNTAIADYLKTKIEDAINTETVGISDQDGMRKRK